MSVRRINQDDFPQIVDIAERFHAESVETAPFSRESVYTALFSAINSPNQNAFVSIQDEKIAGGIIVYVAPLYYSEQLVMFECGFYVCPESRSGAIRICKELIDAAIAWGREKGAKEARFIDTARINENAYARLLSINNFDTLGTVYRRSM